MYRFFVACLCISCFFSTMLLSNNFVIGTTSAYAPYVSLSETGEYVGFDIDVANEIAKRLDSSLIIKDFGSMPALFLALKQKKVDALLWAISITESRKQQMDMIYYQGKQVTEMPLLFWKEIPEGISSIEDMKDKPKAIICTEAGSYQEGFLQKIPGLTLKQVDKIMDGIMEIQYKKAQAVMVDPSLVPTLKKQFTEVTLLSVPLPQEEQSLGNGICINQDNKMLSGKVQKIIEAMRLDGTIESLERKWNLVEE